MGDYCSRDFPLVCGVYVRSASAAVVCGILVQSSGLAELNLGEITKVGPSDQLVAYSRGILLFLALITLSAKPRSLVAATSACGIRKLSWGFISLNCVCGVKAS